MIDIDGNEYTIVKIGEQYWTVENLKTTKFNDGSPIPFIDNKYNWSMADDNKTPAYCYYNDDARSMLEYGALYNWYAVNTGKLAPKGWRVPTNDDWAKLEDASDTSGFSALPRGCRSDGGNFFNIGVSGYRWSATEYNVSPAYNRFVYYSNEYLSRNINSKGYGYPVRLVRDSKSSSPVEEIKSLRELTDLKRLESLPMFYQNGVWKNIIYLNSKIKIEIHETPEIYDSVH